MWNEIVTSYNNLAKDAVTAFWLHPVIVSAFILSQPVLFALLTTELMKSSEKPKADGG